jgi:hypothetical protein
VNTQPLLHALLILVVLAYMGGPTQAQDPLIGKLDALGFFRYSTEENRRSVIEAINRRGWGGIFADESRLVHADAEELAEGGFGEFLHEMAPLLNKVGVAAPNVDEQYGDQYIVALGARRATIWSHQDLVHDSTHQGYLWGIAGVRSFQLVNDLLASNHSTERIYAVYGGNDLFAFLLTPELFDLIATHPRATKKDLPYVPTTDWPWFGQPN